MKILHGKTANISGKIIGKVTCKPIFFSRKYNYILATKEGHFGSGYAAFIVEKNYQNKIKEPIFYDVDDFDELENGDIVSLDPNGTINILYKKNSFNNALLITERCNAACIMCPQTQTKAGGDNTEVNLKLISLMDKKTPYLGITGGEPTIIKDRLLTIINECKKRLPFTQLALLTNGILFKDFNYVKNLMMIQHPRLSIEIPLYADTDTEHNNIVGCEGFHKTIKGIYNIAKFRHRVTIRIVILKLNYKRLLNLAEFIYRNIPFVYHVAFMQMETSGLARENVDKLWIDPSDYIESLEKAVTFLSQRDMRVSIYNAQLCLMPRNLWPYARKSISKWKNIYPDKCTECDCQEECGGLFASATNELRDSIKPIKTES